MKEPLAKQILDKYATVVIPKEAIYLKDNVAGVNQKKKANYGERGFKGDEILWIPPNNCVRFEFEDTPEKNQTYISDIESNAKSLEFDYCITSHGGKSDYFNMFNIKGIPLTDDNQNAKLLLADVLMSKKAKDQLDRTNLGRTLSPVIGNEHWKPKYNGAIHKILRGKNPLEHNNEYPKELLRQLNKSKKVNKQYLIKTKQSSEWVSDFLLNYCCNNPLPKGARHYVIEKNLASYIIHRKDKQEIKEKYYKAQERTHDSLRTWETAILKGDYTNVSAGELAKFIKDYGLPFEVPIIEITEQKQELKECPDDLKEILIDPKLYDLIDNEFDKKIVKEKKARKTIFIFTLGRLVQNCENTSYNLCLSDDSGLGKDWLVKSILSIYPNPKNINEKIYIKTEKITPEVLDALSKKVNWNYKIFYNEDIRVNVLNSETFKTFSSGAELFYTYKDGEAIPTEIEGNPVMIITTAKSVSSDELTRRYVNCGLTDSINQTKEIMKRWAKFKAKGIKPEYDPKIIEALTYLKPIKFKVPFAEYLPDYFPPQHNIMRTQWGRFLDIIGAITCLFQYQRIKDDEGFLLSTWFDYDFAIDILIHLFGKDRQIPLSKTEKKIIKALKDLRDRIRISTLETKTHFTPKTLRNALMKMADFGIVTVDETNEEENTEYKIKKPTMVFSLIELDTSVIKKSKDILVDLKIKLPEEEYHNISNNNNNNNFNTFNNNKNINNNNNNNKPKPPINVINVIKGNGFKGSETKKSAISSKKQQNDPMNLLGDLDDT